jgi:hypothetical protein
MGNTTVGNLGNCWKNPISGYSWKILIYEPSFVTIKFCLHLNYFDLVRSIIWLDPVIGKPAS